MALMQAPVCDFGAPAPDFSLRGIDGNTWSLAECRGKRGTLVMFICNHCPYVQAIQERLVRDTRALLDQGVKSVAIMPNDPGDYPEDSFDNMQRVAARLGYPFPYLIDDTQSVARSYGAICTPDFFGYDADLRLQYRGRLDESGRQPAPPEARRELYEAMVGIAHTGQGPRTQVPSMGCSIKWAKPD